MEDLAVVTIGASAGGVEAVRDIVTPLPADLNAAVLVVVHIPANVTSVLPDILSRAAALPAAHAVDGDKLTPGRILVAPPDRHLVVHDGKVALTRTPKENNHRPAIDALFRSAAAAHGPQVMGVIASGNLDDGTLGLVEVKTHGGVTVVQDPESAHFPSMPASAIADDDVDHVAAPYTIADIIQQFAATVHERGQTRKAFAFDHASHLEAVVDDPVGVLAPYTCPSCQGPLWEREQGGVLRYRCRIGHAWSENSLEVRQADEVEDSLWTAVRTLREKAALSDRLAARARERGMDRAARHHEDHAAESRRHADVIRRSVETLRPTVMERLKAD